jgi:hypothetical protein
VSCLGSTGRVGNSSSKLMRWQVVNCPEGELTVKYLHEDWREDLPSGQNSGVVNIALKSWKVAI